MEINYLNLKSDYYDKNISNNDENDNLDDDIIIKNDNITKII